MPYFPPVLLSSGASVGATVQAQSFTNGIAVSTATTFGNHSPTLSGETSSYGYQADSYMNGAGGAAQNIFRRAGGTLASPTATLVGMNLGALSFRGHTGSAFSTTKAFFAAYATQDWSPTANGTAIAISTTPNDSTTLTTAITINQNGYLGAGGIGGPSAAVDTSAGTTTRASLRLRHGSAPTSPNDGDMWTTTAGEFVRINGTTKTVVTVSSPATYTPSNVTTDRTYDANATTLDEVADILGTLIADLKLTGIIL